MRKSCVLRIDKTVLVGCMKLHAPPSFHDFFVNTLLNTQILRNLIKHYFLIVRSVFKFRLAFESWKENFYAKVVFPVLATIHGKKLQRSVSGAIKKCEVMRRQDGYIVLSSLCIGLLKCEILFIGFLP